MTFSEDVRFKLACIQAAERLNGNFDPATKDEVLKSLGLDQAPIAPVPASPADGATDAWRPISIWRPYRREDAWWYLRPEPAPFGDHYASRLAFTALPAPGCSRVGFFGESVAAGYLYAPHLTPAQVLAYFLEQAEPGKTVEVIDLARTNERLATLVETFEQALQLGLSHAVIFVGNNWNLLETPELSGLVPDPQARTALGALLAEGGVEVLLHQAATRLMTKVSDCFERIAQLAAQHQVRVSLVVPQVNLAEWESHQPPPFMAEDRLVAWYEAFFEALSAWDGRETAKVRQAAFRMLDLDEGTSPSAFRFLALAWQAEGQTEKAYEAARSEIEATNYATLCFLDAPRANGLAQNMLRRLARLHDFQAIDLPIVFQTLDPECLPGRRFFLDYCHLTFEGMRAAMAAVAESLLSDQVPERDWQALLARFPGPAVAAEVHAVACLGAAVHTAHRECAVADNQDRVTYWLREALSHAPAVAATLVELVQVRLARVPTPFTPAQQRNQVGRFRLGFQHGWRYEHLDVKILKSLDAVFRDLDLESVDVLACRQRAVGAHPVELVDPYYLWDPLQRYYSEVMPFDDLPSPAYHRSPWPFSSFALVSDGRHDLYLQMTARLPGALADQDHPVVICIDDQAHASFRCGRRWSKHSFVLEKGWLPAGIRKLTLCWPIPAAAVRDAKGRILQRLSRGAETALHPTFGELFSLVVSRHDAPAHEFEVPS